MTREEAIYILKCLNPNGDMYSADSDEEIEEALMMAIEALEQEPILDRIKAEIEQEYKVELEHPYGQGLRRAIEIIDKYKGESEE